MKGQHIGRVRPIFFGKVKNREIEMVCDVYGLMQ